MLDSRTNNPASLTYSCLSTHYLYIITCSIFSYLQLCDSFMSCVFFSLLNSDNLKVSWILSLLYSSCLYRIFQSSNPLLLSSILFYDLSLLISSINMQDIWIASWWYLLIFIFEKFVNLTVSVLVAVAPSSNSCSCAAPTITTLSWFWWLRKE